MRSASDLITELDTEAKEFGAVLLAVAFEHGITYIASFDSDRLHQLEKAVSSGGVPIAMLGITKKENRLETCGRLLAEYEHGELAIDCLDDIMEDAVARLVDGLERDRKSWTN